MLKDSGRAALKATLTLPGSLSPLFLPESCSADAEVDEAPEKTG